MLLLSVMPELKKLSKSQIKVFKLIYRKFHMTNICFKVDTDASIFTIKRLDTLYAQKRIFSNAGFVILNSTK